MSATFVNLNEQHLRPQTFVTLTMIPILYAVAEGGLQKPKDILLTTPQLAACWCDLSMNV